MNKKRVAVLGATGSIGRQCLQVISSHPELFEAEVLTAHDHAEALIELAIKHQPNSVVISNPVHYPQVAQALTPYPIKVFAGEEALCDVVGWESVDIVLNALVGFSGLAPTLSALQSGKPVALANKESLVAGGHLVMEAAFASHVPVIPVDSEHSAIFQCLLGEVSPIEKLILTASGGPFFRTPKHELPYINKEQALHHPNWSMGPKVTIDSATMMNKGLEVIEAHRLFGLPHPKIEIVIHPQSIIHSMVQFQDGSLKAQLSHPDMRIPIQFALSFPQRLPLETLRLNFGQLANLEFYPVNQEQFPCVALAYDALQQGGNAPCALNAANEIAVHAFLHDMIPFHHIPKIIENTMKAIPSIPQPSYTDILHTNAQARGVAQNLLTKKS